MLTAQGERAELWLSNVPDRATWTRTLCRQSDVVPSIVSRPWYHLSSLIILHIALNPPAHSHHITSASHVIYLLSRTRTLVLH